MIANAACGDPSGWEYWTSLSIFYIALILLVAFGFLPKKYRRFLFAVGLALILLVSFFAVQITGC